MTFINALKTDLAKQTLQLNERKEKLFKTATDCKNWGYTQGSYQDMIKHKDALLFDKESAFKFMLSKETQALHEKEEEINFYTNMIYDECRRVGKDNGDMLIENFMDKAELQTNYIEQVSSR